MSSRDYTSRPVATYSKSSNLADTIPSSYTNKSKKISAISDRQAVIIIIIFVALIVIWTIFYLVCYWKQKLFFNYTRPGTLPGEVGDPIKPDSNGYNIPSGSLTNYVVYLGGDPIPLNDKQKAQNAKMTSEELKAWKGWNSPKPNPANDDTIAFYASAQYFL